MRLGYCFVLGCFVLGAQWVWAAGGAPGFNYSLPDTTAAIHAVVVDAAGNTYLTGSTQSSTFPTTPGVFQPQFGGGQCVVNSIVFTGAVPCDDAFVVKLDPTGAVVWATYLGGSGNDVGDSIAVDAAGNVYVAGVTSPGAQGAANSFPTTTGAVFTAPAVLPPGATQGDGFLVKISSDGSQMIYGTYLPGAAYAGSVAMAIDSSGNAYVAAAATPAGFDFPTTAGAYRTSSSAFAAGVIVKLNPAGSALVYATYLGGNGAEDKTLPSAIAVDSSGNAYITGSAPADFPVTAGAFQTVSTGGAFVTKLNAAGSGLMYSTFLGGSGTGNAIEVDSQGRAYILGQVNCGGACPATNTADFPTTRGAFDPAGAPQPPWALTGSINQFLASLSADGSSLVYGTYISGAVALDVDTSGDAYVTGNVLGGFPVSAGAFEQCFSANGFAAEFSPAGALEQASYFGAPGTIATAIAVGQNGLVSIAANIGGTQNYFVANLRINNPLQQDAPCMSLTVENAASYYSGIPSAIAPGELVALRGVGIGPESGVSGTPAGGVGGRLPTELAGVEVYFDEFAAPLMYVQSQQINVAVPWEIAGRTSTQVHVVYNGVPLNAATLTVLPSAPGLFYLSYASQQAAILNADGSINSASNPAKAGDVISLFGTGGGPTSPAGVTGGYWELNANTLLTLPVTVHIEDLNAPVVYAGAAPGLLSSFFQINVRVPPGLPPSPALGILVLTGQQGTNNMGTVAVQ
jgi:uncharacterized protein (TIGR03437 family)